MKPKKIILMGMSASGKDTLRKMLIDRGFKPAISYTTRPIRPGEKDGENYHFVLLEEFEKLEAEDFFIESEPFKVEGGDIWKYGKSKQTIEDADIFIATPSGVSNMLRKLDRNMFYVVEIQCNPAERYARAVLRGDDRREANRRMKADAMDFKAPRDFEVDEILHSEETWPFENFVEQYLRVPPLY